MGPRVAKKKKSEAGGASKRYGTLVRVSDAFADALRRAAQLDDVTQADFADTHLLPVIDKKYREAVAREMKRLSGEK